ncbi:MAG: glycoside hydrolase family 76 protein [Promethearchaeia archaeon]
MKKNTLVVAVVLLISTQVLFMVPSLVVGEIDEGELREDLTEKNVGLQEKLFKPEIEGGLDGKADNNGQSYPDTELHAQENIIASSAFYTRYTRSGNAKAEDWGEDLFTALGTIASGGKVERNEEEGVYYTADQGMVLEFLSIAYRHSQNQEITNLMETTYSSLGDFEANETVGYSGFPNAYWRAIDSNGNKENPEDEAFKFCYTNSSLWAIIGMLNFGQEVEDTIIDNDHDYSGTSVTQAKQIIQFCEDYAFLNGTGFLEYPYANMTDSKKYFHFNTQVLGALAYTRLYQATEEQLYLDKANMLVEYIIPAYFLDTGEIGGCVSRISVATGKKSNIKYGYDNALYAYALLNLYDATNEQTYLQRAEEITRFMNDNLYKVSKDDSIVGYTERLVEGNVTEETLRYWRTNSLMLYVNEEVMWEIRPWYLKYMWFLIIGAIVILAIIGIIILIRRRNRIFKKGAEFAEGVLET